MQDAVARGIALEGATLYSTLEPCAFHGRTPACAHAIVARGVRHVVVGILDPNPRVDGEGLRILRAAGAVAHEGVCALEITHQLAPWIFRYHPHEPLRRCLALHAASPSAAETARLLAAHYGVDLATAEDVVSRATADAAR
jgi:hypothetical protein